MPRNYFVRLFQEYLGSTQYWPPHIRTYMFQYRQLTGAQRAAIIIFLIRNGISQELVYRFFRETFNPSRQEWAHIYRFTHMVWRFPDRYGFFDVHMRAFVPSQGNRRRIANRHLYGPYTNYRRADIYGNYVPRRGTRREWRPDSDEEEYNSDDPFGENKRRRFE